MQKAPYHLTTRKMLQFPGFVFKAAVLLRGDSDVIPV